MTTYLIFAMIFCHASETFLMEQNFMQFLCLPKDKEEQGLMLFLLFLQLLGYKRALDVCASLVSPVRELHQ